MRITTPTLWAFHVKFYIFLVPNQGTIGSGLVRLSVCPSVCLSVRMSVRLSRFNGGRLEPKRMGGSAWTDYIQIWFVDA